MAEVKNKKEMTLMEFLHAIKGAFRFLVSKWKIIILSAFLGTLIGIIYGFLVPVKYISTTTFVVEESKSAGGLASLAGQFGLDIGSVSSGGGVFSGDNILLFLKSESLCRQTLMTPYDAQSTKVLADRYAEVTGLKKSWRNSKKVGEISFAKFIGKPLPRKEDSLIQYLIRKKIILNDLYVFKPDKKASFINVSTVMKDELLSKLFNERLVSIATDLYIQSKIKIKQSNVNMLQQRADSLAAILNDKTYIAASSQQSLIDANPALRTNPIRAEISTREKSMVSTIFAEVVKNLEISKTILSQEVPAIQLIDQSSLPLEKKKVSKLVAGLLFGMISGVLVILYFLIGFWIKNYLGVKSE